MENLDRAIFAAVLAIQETANRAREKDPIYKARFSCTPPEYRHEIEEAYTCGFIWCLLLQTGAASYKQSL